MTSGENIAEAKMVEAVRVSCHCGNVRLLVTAPLDEVVECNCSICTRSGFLHWYVPPEAVQLEATGRSLSTYAWRTVTGGQHFCPTCGIAVIRTSTQYPPPVSINARCIEGVEVATLPIRQFDSRHAYP
jgi:hypothetical protein